MPILKIVTGQTTPVLRAKTAKIEKIDKAVQKLIKDMSETVVDAEGLGLAAPQIGQSLRLCLARFAGKMQPMINPEITWRSDQTDRMVEGCLSLPGIEKEVERPVEIIVKFLNIKGEKQERHLKKLDARVVQHEVDHLEGVLITDH